MLNSKQKGNVTEIETMLYFLERGYTVSKPYGDCEKYDLIIDINEKLYKIQCKTSLSKDNGKSFSFSTRTNTRKDGKTVHYFYSKNEIDFFATSFNKKIYLIPLEECHSGKILRLEDAANNQEKNIVFASDYEADKILNKL